MILPFLLHFDYKYYITKTKAFFFDKNKKRRICASYFASTLRISTFRSSTNLSTVISLSDMAFSYVRFSKSKNSSCFSCLSEATFANSLAPPTYYDIILLSFSLFVNHFPEFLDFYQYAQFDTTELSIPLVSGMVEYC